MSNVEVVVTMENKPWDKDVCMYGIKPKVEIINDDSYPEIAIDTKKHLQTIEGFGACFNERGWSTISSLEKEDCETVMKELFSKEGSNYNLMRLPIGSNDFSKGFYTFNETPDDFEMEHFSIERDHQYMIPFVKEAMRLSPEMKIWASPWCPPTWMKENKHYACRAAPTNDLAEDKQGVEGGDIFICEDKYFKAYSKYFGKFVDAYKKEGIDIYMVMPQNEFNSAQPFPSCVWSPPQLVRFLRFLIPEMEGRGIDVGFGTVERPDPRLVETILDSDIGSHIKAVGFQWASKSSIPTIHAKYPNVKLMQSEHECMDGSCCWTDAWYTWHLIQHFLQNGAVSYDFWNIAAEKENLSTWNAGQNSLISIDVEKKTYVLNPEFYIFKHFTHYIQRGAKMLDIQTHTDALAFLNPDGSVVVEVFNETRIPRVLIFSVDNVKYSYMVMPKSVNTFFIKKQ